jgi:hypothetical protein
LAVACLELAHQLDRHCGAVEAAEVAHLGAVLAEGRVPPRLEVHGVGEHEHRLLADEAVREQLRDQVLALVGDPVVDDLAAAVGVTLQVQGLDVDAVLRSEQVDPVLVGLEPRAGPDPIGHRDSDLVVHLLGEPVVNDVPGMVGRRAVGEPEG